MWIFVVVVVVDIVIVAIIASVATTIAININFKKRESKITVSPPFGIKLVF